MTEQSNHPEESFAGTFFSELKRRKVVRVALVYLGMGCCPMAASESKEFGGDSRI